jgi:hypothetical protein
MMEVCDGALLTTREVVPAEPPNTGSPEYAPEIVSVPAGAAWEVHEPVPLLNNVAVQSGVDPVENATDPVGVGGPGATVVTVAEYVTDVPSVTGLGFTPIADCDGSSTTRVVVPFEPENALSPEYVPEIESVPIGAADEVHEPLPFDSVAVQRGVVPVRNTTDPVGAGNPFAPVVTVVE